MMTTYEYNDLLDEIRVNLMAYIWSGEGEEVAASFNLQQIFETLGKAHKEYEKAFHQYSDLYKEKLDKEIKIRELGDKIRELEKES